MRFATFSSSRRTAFSSSVSSGGGYGGHVLSGVCTGRFEMEGTSLGISCAQAVGSEERKGGGPWTKLESNCRRAGGSDEARNEGRVA